MSIQEVIDKKTGKSSNNLVEAIDNISGASSNNIEEAVENISLDGGGSGNDGQKLIAFNPPISQAMSVEYISNRIAYSQIDEKSSWLNCYLVDDYYPQENDRILIMCICNRGPFYDFCTVGKLEDTNTRRLNMPDRGDGVKANAITDVKLTIDSDGLLTMITQTYLELTTKANLFNVYILG